MLSTALPGISISYHVCWGLQIEYRSQKSYRNSHYELNVDRDFPGCQMFWLIESQVIPLLGHSINGKILYVVQGKILDWDHTNWVPQNTPRIPYQLFKSPIPKSSADACVHGPQQKPIYLHHITWPVAAQAALCHTGRHDVIWLTCSYG